MASRSCCVRANRAIRAPGSGSALRTPMYSTPNSWLKARTSEARRRISAGRTSLRSKILTATFFASGLSRSQRRRMELQDLISSDLLFRQSRWCGRTLWAWSLATIPPLPDDRPGGSTSARTGNRRIGDRRQRRRSAGNPPRSTPPRPRASAAPSARPFGTPRAMKSAALSGNAGALQRAGSVASACQRHLAAPCGARVQASSTRSVKRASRADRAGRAPPCSLKRA